MRLLHAFSDVEVQERLESLYVDSRPWAREAIVTVAGSVTFSSDRTIVERANDVWK
jgi:glucan phosphorylase